MNDCDECPIETKLTSCCLCHPETYDTQFFVFDKNLYVACPNLDETAHCRIYDSRPTPCKIFDCEKHLTEW